MLMVTSLSACVSHVLAAFWKLRAVLKLKGKIKLYKCYTGEKSTPRKKEWTVVDWDDIKQPINHYLRALFKSTYFIIIFLNLIILWSAYRVWTPPDWDRIS